MKKKIIPFIAAIALIIVVVLFMVLGNIIEKYTPSKETKDLSEYYGLTSDTDVALICNNEVIDTKGKLVNGEVYLSYETVRISMHVFIGIPMKISSVTQLPMI